MINSDRPRLWLESFSDTSQTSTKVLPPSSPKDSQRQASAILTRSRLHQAAMAANYHGQYTALLEVDRNGNRRGDELLTSHCQFAPPQGFSRTQNQSQYQPMADELNTMSIEAQEARRIRVISEMDKRDREGQTNGTFGGSYGAANGAYAAGAGRSEPHGSARPEGSGSSSSTPQRQTRDHSSQRGYGQTRRS